MTTSLSVGGHTITAVYGGDTNFTGSTSTGLTQTVNKGATTTALTSSAEPQRFGQSVTFTATVSVTTPASGTPTGTVTFKDGATTLGTGTLYGRGGDLHDDLAVGRRTHSITAVYGGNSNFTGSTSSGLTQTVNQGVDDHGAGLVSRTRRRVRSVGDLHGDRLSVTTPASGTPTGTVTFKDGATTLGTGTLSGGVATLHDRPRCRSAATPSRRSMAATPTSPDRPRPA